MLNPSYEKLILLGVRIYKLFRTSAFRLMPNYFIEVNNIYIAVLKVAV